MKLQIISALIGFLPLMYSAQISIGKSLTAADSEGILLDFSNENKGIILPWVTNETAVASAVDGTFILDVSTKKVKYKKNGVWEDLSAGAMTTNAIPNQYAIDNPAAKVVLGATSSTVDGVLVLEGNTKAMVLPKVSSPHLNISNPAPGMMVFDSTKKLLCLYNGTEWSFWTYMP